MRVKACIDCFQLCPKQFVYLGYISRLCFYAPIMADYIFKGCPREIEGYIGMLFGPRSYCSKTVLDRAWGRP